jgi:hypothetical protein
MRVYACMRVCVCVCVCVCAIFARNGDLIDVGQRELEKVVLCVCACVCVCVCVCV